MNYSFIDKYTKNWDKDGTKEREDTLELIEKSNKKKKNTCSLKMKNFKTRI